MVTEKRHRTYCSLNDGYAIKIKTLYYSERIIGQQIKPAALSFTVIN